MRNLEIGAIKTPVSGMTDRDAIIPLRDGGIRWVFYFRKADVPGPELWTSARAERQRFLRLAVTFGASDRGSREYRSTTVVHLWQMRRLPPSVSWRQVFVHVFTHEPLHHAIGRSLAEMGEWGDQEWVVAKLGDGRWW